MNSPPTRRSLVGALAGASTLGFAGCLDDSQQSSDPPSLAEEFDCEQAERPAPNGHGGEQHVDPLPYPDPPDVSDDDAVEQFVWDSEKAYVQNDAIDRYGADLLRFGLSLGDLEFLGREGAVAFVSLYYSTQGKTTGSYIDNLSGGFGTGVTYAVDDFGAARVEAGVEKEDRQVTGGIPSEDSESHPLVYGRLVACFDDGTNQSGDPPSLDEEFDCEQAERPAPNGHGGEQHVDPLPYPDPPDVSDDDAVEEFVKAHERAYVRNADLDRYGADLLEHNFDVGDMKLLGREGSVAFVCLYYGTEGKTTDSYLENKSGGFEYGVTYAVDDFGSARADVDVGTEDRQVTGGIPSEESESHPIENGRLVVCFDD